MPMLARPCNPTVPANLSRNYSDPNAKETYNYGFKRLISFLQSPPVSAGILSITLFYFIAFFSNVLLAQVSQKTIGITVTLGTFGLLALVVFLLFLF